MKKNRTVLVAGLIVLAGWLAAYFGIIHPGYINWGAAPDEIRRALPGDERATVSGFRATRAATIDAPAAKVWSWISQVGIGRGGFYSYDWLENLFLAGIHNAFPETPSWPERAEGEFVRSFQFGAEKAGINGWHFEIIAPGRSFFLNPLWGPFAAEPLGPSQTRLLVRSVGEARGPVAAFLLGLFFDPIHFTMEKRMILSVKSAAEGLPPFSALGTIVACIGFALAAAAAAGVIMTRKRLKIWILIPLLWAAVVLFFARDIKSALVAFTAGSLIVAGFRLFGRRGWAVVLGFWIYALLVLIYAIDAFVVFGIVFLAATVSFAGVAAADRKKMRDAAAPPPRK
jgi:hypothetical protein